MTRFSNISLIVSLTLLLGLNSQASTDQNRVADSPDKICPILIGSPVPTVSLKTLDGKKFDLDSSIAKKPTVLIYFRGGW